MQLTFYQPAVKRAVTYVYYIQNDLFLLQMHKKKKVQSYTILINRR